MAGATASEPATPGEGGRRQPLGRPEDGTINSRSRGTIVVSMRKLTITLEDEVARWVRVRAARHETSVSRFLGRLLRERMDQEVGYEQAMRQFLGRRPVKLKKKRAKYPSREAVHE